MKIRMRNLQTGLIKECPVGFSWTTFFFGWFVPLVRGWIGYSMVVLATTFITSGLAQIYFAFVINKQYIKHLLSNGFVPHSDVDYQVIQRIGFQIQTQNNPFKNNSNVVPIDHQKAA